MEWASTKLSSARNHGGRYWYPGPLRLVFPGYKNGTCRPMLSLLANNVAWRKSEGVVTGWCPWNQKLPFSVQRSQTWLTVFGCWVNGEDSKVEA